MAKQIVKVTDMRPGRVILTPKIVTEVLMRADDVVITFDDGSTITSPNDGAIETEVV